MKKIATIRNIREFMAAMFAPALGHDGFVEVRWLTGRQRWFRLDLAGIDQAARAIGRNRVNACWGLGIRRRVGRGRNDDVEGATTLWVDLDQDLTSWRHFPPSPSAVVNSGHGIHCYWFLDHIASAADFVALRQAATMALGGDIQASKDAARVARAVGAINQNSSKGPPVAVMVEEMSGERYRLEDLRAAVCAATSGPFEVVQPRSSRSSGRPRARGDDKAPAWLARVYDAITAWLETHGHQLRGTADGGLMTTCPLHHDHGPSLSIHPVKGWHCFAGCGSGRLTVLAHRLETRV